VPATYPATCLRLAAVVVIVAACATAPSTQYGSRAPVRSPHLLTAEDISRVQVTSAYEAVERLKPNFLLGMRGEAIRAVYLNGTRLLGGLENLRSIDASTIQQIVFLNGIEASTFYGSGNGAGVLLVSTLPARRW
jgi:hypothetical protein